MGFYVLLQTGIYYHIRCGFFNVFPLIVNSELPYIIPELALNCS